MKQITPMSSNSFIESVRLCSIRKALFKLVFHIFNSFAISSKVSPLWSFFSLPFPISPHLYPLREPYISKAFLSLDGSFFLLVAVGIRILP